MKKIVLLIVAAMTMAGFTAQAQSDSTAQTVAAEEIMVAEEETPVVEEASAAVAEKAAPAPSKKQERKQVASEEEICEEVAAEEDAEHNPLSKRDLWILVLCIAVPGALFIWGWQLCKNGEAVVFTNVGDMILFVAGIGLLVWGICLTGDRGFWNALTIVGLVAVGISLVLTIVSNVKEGTGIFLIVIALVTKMVMALAIVIVLVRLLSAYTLRTATTTTVNGVSRRLFKYERESNFRQASEIAENCMNFLRTFIND